VPDFKEVSKMFDRYCHRQKIKKAPRASERAEALKRLRQIEWIVAQVQATQRFEDRLEKRGPRLPKEDTREARALSHAKWAAQMSQKGRQVELFSEAFYYFAFRFARALDGVDPFPKGFYKRLKLNLVRNHLIEHPTVLDPNFSWGSDMVEGPRIKPFGGRADGKPRVHDSGLYVNAEDLIDNVVAELRPHWTQGGA